MNTYEDSLYDFTGQFDYVLENYHPHKLRIQNFQNVVLGGLGGSGIAAAIAKNWFFDAFPVPVETVNDYHLPAYSNEKTMVVLNSYSGNTEETLSLYDDAVSRSCKLIIIASGGRLLELAKEHNHLHYIISGGFQPRMTIGFGLGFQLLILGELIGRDLRAELTEIRDKFEENHEAQLASAEKIFNFYAANLKQKFVILSDRCFAPVALRFAQQVNENAKLEAFVNVLPESNHNVIESYVDRLPCNFLMLYTDKNPRVAARFDFVLSHLEVDNNKVLPLFIPEFSLLSIFDMIYRLDWVSVIMANEINAPLMEVPVINSLKEYLSELEIIEREQEDE
jgi:glucose/mannose-6-phosphate isomerase